MSSLGLSLRPYRQIPQDPASGSGWDQEHDREYGQGQGWDEGSSSDAISGDTTTAARTASLRLYWLTAVLCCGGALFGYDSGVIGGVLTFDSFQRDFNFITTDKTRISSIAVGIQQAGALLGCLAIWPLTNRHGRRAAMMLCSAIFCTGVLLETIRSGSIAVFYLGRVICGLGIGGSATIIPIYLGEMSPKDKRARLGSCYQFTFTIGIFVSYWVDYGVVKLVDASSSRQWQIPIALQLIPGALMGLGMLTLPESARWLLFKSTTSTTTITNTTTKKENTTAAWQSLTWIRASTNPPTQTEFTTLQTALKTDLQARATTRPTDLLTHKPNLHRLSLGCMLFLAQQSTGATALAYFGPQFFAMLVGPRAEMNLLLTGVFGGVKVVACFVFVVFVAERFGRRPLLISGAVFMSVCMVITAFMVKTHPPSSPSPSSPQSNTITTPALLTTTLIYLTITAFNLSWGPLPWPCISELFPPRIRDPGVAIGIASQWLFNFLWSFSTPYLMAGIGWATFLLFGVLDLVFAGLVGCYLVETRGRSLEDIEGLFEGVEYRTGQGQGVRQEEDGWKGSDEDEPLRHGVDILPRYSDTEH